jgi:hypothetical protein
MNDVYVSVMLQLSEQTVGHRFPSAFEILSLHGILSKFSFGHVALKHKAYFIFISLEGTLNYVIKVT